MIDIFYGDYFKVEVYFKSVLGMIMMLELWIILNLSLKKFKKV